MQFESPNVSFELDGLRFDLQKAGFGYRLACTKTKDGCKALNEPASGVTVSRVLCRGEYRFRVQYVNPDGKKGTVYKNTHSAVVEMVASRWHNFKLYGDCK